MSEELKEKEENKIITGLKQAVEFAKGDESKARVTNYEIKTLLSKTSKEIKKERKIEKIDTIEIMEILYQFSPDSDNRSYEENQKLFGEIYTQIGLSPRSWRDDRSKGFGRKTTKYALLGLLAEKNKEKNHTFSFEELIILFNGLFALSTLAPLQIENVKNLQKTVAKLLTKE